MITDVYSVYTFYYIPLYYIDFVNQYLFFNFADL